MTLAGGSIAWCQLFEGLWQACQARPGTAGPTQSQGLPDKPLSKAWLLRGFFTSCLVIPKKWGFQVELGYTGSDPYGVRLRKKHPF